MGPGLYIAVGRSSGAAANSGLITVFLHCQVNIIIVILLACAVIMDHVFSIHLVAIIIVELLCVYITNLISLLLSVLTRPPLQGQSTGGETIDLSQEILALRLI